MSQISQTTPSNLTEVYPVTSLTLVVLLLIPCVVVLLLLNCLLLGYKLLNLSKKNSRLQPGHTDEMYLRSPQRVRLSDVAFPLRRGGRRAYLSLSEPVLPHPVTSSRASSRERVGLDHRIRLLRPDGATGSGSPRAPSTIRATSPEACLTPRLDLASRSRTYSLSKAGWCKSAPVLLHDSGTETRVNLVPPNSPMEPEFIDLIRSSTYDMLADVNPGVSGRGFDKADMECEYTSLPSETSCLSMSAVGPGLDSDFGASAVISRVYREWYEKEQIFSDHEWVSLRILSADSDGLSNGVLASTLEWDYYDPCYVKQNNIPKHKHHRPAIHMKQYWV